MKKKHHTEKSEDRRVVEQALLEVAPGAVITVKALTCLCPGRDFSGKDSSLLWRIMQGVAREHGAIFDFVRGRGYQRADDKLKVGGTTPGLAKARRVMKRGVVNRVAAIENFVALPLAQKAVAVVNGSIAAAMLHATKAATLKKLGASVGDAKVLPPVETLRLLAERTGK